MSNPIKPTVGRTVLYALPEGDKRVGETRPATVVRVNPDTCNLHVILDGPNDGNRSYRWVGSAAYDQPAEGAEPKPGTWHWMPYQLATAAKA